MLGCVTGVGSPWDSPSATIQAGAWRWMEAKLECNWGVNVSVDAEISLAYRPYQYLSYTTIVLVERESEFLCFATSQAGQGSTAVHSPSVCVLRGVGSCILGIARAVHPVLRPGNRVTWLAWHLFHDFAVSSSSLAVFFARVRFPPAKQSGSVS